MTREVRIDFDRLDRIGFTEAVLCQGKTPGQIGAALEQARDRGAAMLLTRLDEPVFRELEPTLRDRIDYDPQSRTGIYGDWAAPAGPPRIAVVTAGTTDLPVAREAVRTLGFYGVAAKAIADVGVAGLWRLLEQKDEICRYPVLIVVAGMDGALFSVLGGLAQSVIIAVPTSTGYGATRGGRTALDSALVSCAPGVVAVNVDNGYGGACAAMRVLRAINTATVETGYDLLDAAD